MAVSPEVVDWLACCYHEQDAPKFVNIGVDSINKLRSLPEDQFREIGLDAWMYDQFHKLQDRTSTVEELSQEVSNISLYAACQRGQQDRVEMMLENGGADINWRNPYFDEWTPLIVASQRGHTAVVDLLISSGAHVNDTDGGNRTALHYSAIDGHVETSQCLIKHSANVNAVEGFGWTPAHLAALYGHLDVLKVLHQHGADLSLRDRGNCTPLDWSRQKNHTAVTAYLESVANEPALPQPSPSPSPPPSPSRQPSAQPSFTSAAGTQNRNLVKKHIEQQGSLAVRALKAFLIGPPCVGKTTARRRLTEEIMNISPDEIVPSTGIESPLTVQLYHPTEQSSVLLSTGWHCQGLEELCSSICSRVLNSPADPPAPSSSSSTSSQPRQSSPQSTIPAHSSTHEHLSRPTSLVEQGDPTQSTKDDVTTTLTALVAKKDWESIRERLKNVNDLTFLQIIDIGGQPEFHEILPLILQGLALNLIFLNVMQNLDLPYQVVYRGISGPSQISYDSEFTIRELIQRILCSISSLQEIGYHKPTAILIGTHLDLAKKGEAVDLEKSIQESFKDADFLKNDVLCPVNKENEETRYIHPLDNVSEDSTDIEELRELITRIVYQAERFPTEEILTGALLLLLILRKKFDPHPGWCSVKNCVKIAECCGISEEYLLKKNGILDDLHNKFGTILFFREVEGLCDRVIVNANIIMGPPSELFVQAFGAKKSQPKTAEHIRKSGEISHDLMNKACSTSKTKDEIPTKEIVDLLKSLHILFEDARSANEDSVYFLPSILYPDHNVAKESSNPIHLNNLAYSPILFLPSCEFVPLGYFSASVVKLSNHWILDEVERFKNRIRFHVVCEDEMLVHVEFRTLSTHLELRVLSDEPSVPINPRLMMQCRSELWKYLSEVNKKFPQVRWRCGFYCPKALKPGDVPHPARCLTSNTPKHVVCSREDCGRGVQIALSDKHKSWFMEVPITATTTRSSTHDPQSQTNSQMATIQTGTSAISADSAPQESKAKEKGNIPPPTADVAGLTFSTLGHHPLGGAKDVMKKHYEDIHSLFQHDPPKIARNLFCKDFIDQSLRTEVTNVQNAMSNESKADMLINAIDKFFDTHTEPDKMLETLLDIFDKCGPLGRNITKKIRNEC